MTAAAVLRPQAARARPRLWLLLPWLAFLLPALATPAGTGRWVDADGRPTPLAQQALALLADAGSHGLDARDYAVPVSQQQAAPDAAALEAALLRYLRDLHEGRSLASARPAGLRRVPFDAAAALGAAASAGDLARAVRAAVPPLSQYERLREALAQYRSLAGDPTWDRPWPELPRVAKASGRALAAGQAWDGLPRLAASLAALGDLADPAEANVPAGAVYEGALVAAVRAFQRRHGLQEDGVVGRATLAALQVSPAARVQQIELALERLRWTPLQDAPRRIVVNIPEFVLRAYELQEGRIVVRTQMKVVVGKAAATRTPLLQEDLRRIEFKPFWNVPPSIARGETIPRLRRDPGYWAREGFEFIGARGVADAQLTEAKLQAVLAGDLRIRQRPGPRNALGDIKFVFPNRQAIYLHHTPSVQLFEQSRRDFSHGCIRVEQPVALAAFALQGMPGWDESRIRAAMGAAEPSSVSLAQPVPVLLAYTTALVKEGRIHFFDDVYGHDRALARALRMQRP
ncbi:MAG TPA: L,D-transpeptidase family protein [Rubrivivax sp.]|nr:L,D-transpeptidase family protein [Rubrivivax sp.]